MGYNIKYVKPYEIRFRHVLIILFVSSFILSFFYVAIGVSIRKDPVVLNENYKGKYVQVKKYGLYNNDSTIAYYNKPLDTTMVITCVCPENRHFHVKYENGDINDFRVVYKRDSKIKYKKGDKVEVTIKFYPKTGIILKK